MKGLQEATETGNIYLVIKHNSICQDSKSPREGFEAVQVNNPKTGESVTKWIKKYRGVEGLICKIEWYDTEERYENRFMGWRIHINANGVPCVLDLPFDSRASSRFMKVAENLDYTIPVEFRAWHDAKTDGTAFYIAQNGEGVRQKYTRDEPGACPAPTQNPISKKWNFDKQKEFLHKRMTEFVIPEVEDSGNDMPYLAPTATSAPVARIPVESEFDDSEIPF